MTPPIEIWWSAFVLLLKWSTQKFKNHCHKHCGALFVGRSNMSPSESVRIFGGSTCLVNNEDRGQCLECKCYFGHQLLSRNYTRHL